MKLGRLRSLTQAVSLILSNLNFTLTPILRTGGVYPFLHCYACPFRIAGCPIGLAQNFVIVGQLPFYLLGFIGVNGVLFGRAFCGWACPFGSFQDLLGSTSKTKKKAPPLSYAKYVMLFIVIAVAWYTLDTLFCKFCPSGSLWAAIPTMLISPFTPGLFWYIHILTLGLTAVLVMFVSRFWCRYLCPLGSIGIFNKVSILSVKYDASRCEQCLRCLEVCPTGIKKISDIGTSSDCIMCGRCVDACSVEALKIGFGRK